MTPAGVCPARVDLPPADGEPVGKFARTLARIWPEGIAGSQTRLGLAVSGGPDSCALLLLAATALPGRIAAATVDHGLRAESAAEAQFVADLCALLKVDHAVLAVSVGQGNVQAEARIARYRALAGWAKQTGLAALASAHHADDQAETLLLRLRRASGVAGLAGVRERGQVRPPNVPLRTFADGIPTRSGKVELLDADAFVEPADAYTKLLQQIRPGEVLVPSPSPKGSSPGPPPMPITSILAGSRLFNSIWLTIASTM